VPRFDWSGEFNYLSSFAVWDRAYERIRYSVSSLSLNAARRYAALACQTRTQRHMGAPPVTQRGLSRGGGG